jgi:hypothetical protein
MIDKRFIFPITMSLLNLGAATMCFLAGDWKRGVYWMAASVCTMTLI